MEDKDKNWVVNLNDPAVRSVCVAIDGEALPPYVPPAAPAAATSKDKKTEVRSIELVKSRNRISRMII